MPSGILFFLFIVPTTLPNYFFCASANTKIYNKKDQGTGFGSLGLVESFPYMLLPNIFTCPLRW